MIRVLIVDDSRVNRTLLEQLMATDPDIEVVGRAADGAAAIRQVTENRPDVVTLDLEMPNVDGPGFLRWLMANRPLPVLVVTSRESNYSLFEALELGALDFILKPGRVSADLPLIQRELIDKIHLLCRMSEVVHGSRPEVAEPELQPPVTTRVRQCRSQQGASRVVVIAASTGGPLALQRVVRRLAPDFPGAILVTQHMPAYSTSFFAERLDEIAELPVREARAGEPVNAGEVLIAPGGWHMSVEQTAGDTLKIRLDPACDEDRYVPSADRLFASAARCLGSACTGVVLTGMGDDGCRGLGAIQQAGGRTFAESPETAVVYGMPRRAVAAGVVDRIVPLETLAAEMEQAVRCGSDSTRAQASAVAIDVEQHERRERS